MYYSEKLWFSGRFKSASNLINHSLINQYQEDVTMKQLFYGFIVVAILCSLPALSFSADRIVNIAPSTATTLVYVDAVIAADSVGRGTADNTTYVLSRDGVYYANSYINNVGWTLRMRSSYGKLSGSGASRSGYPALIFLKVGSSGTTVQPQLVLVAGNVSISNLEICGYDESVTPTAIGTMNGWLMITSAAGFNIVVDSCVITNFDQAILRTVSACSVVKVTNSIFANVGYVGNADIGNGRAIDLRNGSCDSLILVNNTFLNNDDRVIRHYSSTAPIRYAKIDHNTFVNSMSFHGLLSFGYTQGLFSITNNLFVNPWALGNDTDVTRQAEMGDNNENDAYGHARMTIVNAKPDTVGQAVPTTWTFKNNYYRITPTLQTWWTNAGASPALTLPPALPWHISKKVGTDSTNGFQATTVDLTKVPAVMTALMTWYRSPSGGNKTKANGSWTLANDFNRVSYGYLTDTLDCTYPISASIYTAATGGQPVGSLMWWGKTVGVTKSINSVPTGYALAQNYPNPFNPTTNFTYEISKAGFVSIKIYDILGREVATLVNEVKQAGSFAATWNAINAGSGIYFCKMQSGSFTATKKMILMK